ncbi:unnamed protein product [Pleuronectes platessa]|uniref:Uncharacterized protein n=1 Tax=Pleuronectes platessa TaxID=8262 RepID=A0A9N7U7E4_PLEPL|nr:unnamed protein product [Pleuronectes platessa]
MAVLVVRPLEMSASPGPSPRVDYSVQSNEQPSLPSTHLHSHAVFRGFQHTVDNQDIASPSSSSASPPAPPHPTLRDVMCHLVSMESLEKCSSLKLLVTLYLIHTSPLELSKVLISPLSSLTE